MAPAASTPATTRQAMLKPSKNAVDTAAWTAFAECGVAVEASAIGEVECAADGFVGGTREPRSQLRGQPGGQSVAVYGGEDAADHGDAERGSKQAGGVVDSGADAGFGLWHDPHDRLGGGCADESHAAAAEDHLADYLEVAGCLRPRWRPRRRSRRDRTGRR